MSVGVRSKARLDRSQVGKNSPTGAHRLFVRVGASVGADVPDYRRDRRRTERRSAAHARVRARPFSVQPHPPTPNPSRLCKCVERGDAACERRNASGEADTGSFDPSSRPKIGGDKEHSAGSGVTPPSRPRVGPSVFRTRTHLGSAIRIRLTATVRLGAL